jgi:hypothetical protein
MVMNTQQELDLQLSAARRAQPKERRAQDQLSQFATLDSFCWTLVELNFISC